MSVLTSTVESKASRKKAREESAAEEAKAAEEKSARADSFFAEKSLVEQCVGALEDMGYEEVNALLEASGRQKIRTGSGENTRVIYEWRLEDAGILVTGTFENGWLVSWDTEEIPKEEVNTEPPPTSDAAPPEEPRPQKSRPQATPLGINLPRRTP